ncbi:MAG TPA: N-acetylmuramoyl-L-alanine amidase, partial [Verrucomicrobiae bacterium]|nr:N-acetylmuramoyl-L-alanine amidase [Verrucomicrobiae bacterium]
MFVRSVRRCGYLCLLAGGLLLLAGCPAPPKAAPQITILEPSSARPIIPPVDLDTVTLPLDKGLPALNEEPRSVLPEEKLQLPTGMLPVSSWAQLCGFSQARLVPNSNPPAVELESTRGVLRLILGQRFGKWNGINIGFGFPPAAHNGQFTFHSLDVLKSAYPLGLGDLTIPKGARVLVLDPGHGGADPGSKCVTRVAYEKDLALDWALRIERLLANSNWRVILTRRIDHDVSLMDRVAIADANAADLFISLHFNSLEKSGSTPEEAGIETYCITPAGLPSNSNRNFEDDTRRLYPNNEFDAQNLLLATRVQSSLISATSRRDRGVRRARFITVVREQKRPAVLIEGGFL